MVMHPFYKGIFFVIYLLPSYVFGATQGALGTTSSGTVNVSITIPALVQISGLSDITLGSASSFPAIGSTTACVYSNVASPLGSYFVTVTSSNASGGNFRVKDSGTDFIVYSAFWSNTITVNQTPPSLGSGTKTAQQTGGSATSVTCSPAGANANFSVSFNSTQVEGAPAAAYSDTVTILISPT